MRTKICIVVLIVLLSVAGCKRVNWKEFSSANGKFSVMMPGEPQEQHETVKTAVGPVDLYMHILDVGTSAYIVGYSDYPEDLIKNSEVNILLEGARNGAISNIRGTLVNEKDISIAGNPGKEFNFSVPHRPELPNKGIGKSRIFLVGNRLYQCMVVGDKNTKNEDIDK